MIWMGPEMSEAMHCRKCGADISESWQPDEPDVGIVGGWHCDACDVIVAAWEHPCEPMDDDVDIFASTRGQPLEYQPTRCPQHPGKVPALGYGLAGGGFGPYTYCPVCGLVINKTPDPG